ILVVLNRGDGRDHQAARTTYFGLVRQPAVGVLPEDAEILFVHADGVLDRQRLAPAGAEVAVEILDQAQAIAAQLPAVGAHAKAIFSRVNGILARLLRRGVTVGNHHFREGGAIED